MKYENEQLNAEKLSDMIDNLSDNNHQRQAEASDQSLQELVDVAVLLKAAAGQSKPPQQFIDDLADKLAKEAKPQKTKRRFAWLYSGAAGMAAAVMLVAVLNFSPTAPQIVPEQVFTSPQTNTADLPQSEPKNERHDSVNQTTGNSGQTAKVSDNKQRQSNVPDSKTSSVQSPADQTTAPRAGVSKSADSAPARVYKTRIAEVPAEMPSQQVAVLAIPGRTAKSRTIDGENGIVKQIYDFEGDKEITIIQRAKSKTESKDSAAYSLTAVKDNDVPASNKAAKDKANQITAAAGDYEVTVEGDLPNDKLKEIADSLVEIKE